MIHNELLLQQIYDIALQAINDCQNKGSILWALLANYPTLPGNKLAEVVNKADLTAINNFNKLISA